MGSSGQGVIDTVRGKKSKHREKLLSKPQDAILDLGVQTATYGVYSYEDGKVNPGGGQTVKAAKAGVEDAVQIYNEIFSKEAVAEQGAAPGDSDAVVKPDRDTVADQTDSDMDLNREGDAARKRRTRKPGSSRAGNILGSRAPSTGDSTLARRVLLGV